MGQSKVSFDSSDPLARQLPLTVDNYPSDSAAHYQLDCTTIYPTKTTTVPSIEPRIVNEIVPNPWLTCPIVPASSPFEHRPVFSLPIHHLPSHTYRTTSRGSPSSFSLSHLLSTSIIVLVFVGRRLQRTWIGEFTSPSHLEDQKLHTCG